LDDPSNIGGEIADVIALPKWNGHFRQLLVNAIMAKDVFDESLRSGRQSRWAAVFGGGAFSTDPDRRSTIIVEHVIQEADMSHTMQHVSDDRPGAQALFANNVCTFFQ
jgi:hypothetical protein